MDPLGTLKKIREIIKKSNDHELVNLILDLQNDVFAIENHNLVLASELVNLKRQLAALGRMRKRPPFDYYFRGDDEVPFCPKCWASCGRAIHLPAREPSGVGFRRDCRVCKKTYWEPAIAGRSQAHHA